jgi:hypothetical protein
MLPLYLSGELRGAEMAEMRRHLEECEHCATAAQADRELDDSLRTAMLQEPADISAVLGRVYARIAMPWWRRRPQLISLRMGAVALVLVFALLIVFPTVYVHQAQRSMAMAAASDHYEDLVLQRHSDWEHNPEDVTRLVQAQFPQKQNLLLSITPAGASLEKVRLCKLRGTTYVHFVFATGTSETSVYLLANTDGHVRYQAAHLLDGDHGLEVAGFSATGLSGMVVGKHGLVPAEAIAHRLSQVL